MYRLLFNKTVLSIVFRKLAAVVGAFLVKNGWATGSEWQEALGGLSAIYALGHELFAHRVAIKATFDAQIAKSLVPLVLLLGSLAVFTGCAGHQVLNFSKGTGLDLDLPVGYNGANLFEAKIKIGQFYTATAVQVVSTNQQYAPSFAMNSGTDGALNNQLGGTNGGVASLTGGDRFNVAGGAASSGITNNYGAATAVSQH